MSLIEPRDTTTDQPVGTQRVRTQSAFIPGSAQVGLPEGAYEFLFEVRSNIRPPQTHPRSPWEGMAYLGPALGLSTPITACPETSSGHSAGGHGI